MIVGISGKKGHGKDTVANIIRILSTEMGRLSNDEAVAEMVWKIERGEIDPQYLFPKWEIHRFADKLKDMVCVLLGCTREQLEDREFKNTPIEGWDCVFAELCMVDDYGDEEYESDIFSDMTEAQNFITTWGYDENESVLTTRQLTPRLVLQLLGTEGMREVLHPDIHVLATMREYRPTTYSDIAGWIYPSWIIPDTRFPNEAEAIKDRGGILIRINRDGMDLTDEHPSETALDGYDGFNHVIYNTGNLVELVSIVRGIMVEIQIAEAEPQV